MNNIFCIIALLSYFILGFSEELPQANDGDNSPIRTSIGTIKSILEKIESYRSIGYQHKIQDDFIKAIDCYQSILELDPGDYDARLALGRLYISTSDFSKAEDIFQQIIFEDSTDLEAYTGLAEIAGFQDNYIQQIFYLNKILDNAPTDLSTKYRIDKLFQLALVYQYADLLNLSVETLDRIIGIEPTFAEAWAEKGKLVYWADKPYLALTYYQKAIKLDPNHVPYQTQEVLISKLVKYIFNTKQNFLREEENNLDIKHYQHSYRISKRISNSWLTKLSYYSKYSHRNQNGYKSTDLYDTYLWSNKLNIDPNHSIGINLGYSGSDKLLSLADLIIQNNFRFGKLSISNDFTIKSEYFETWFGISRQVFIERFSLDYKKNKFTIIYHNGKIDNNYVEYGSIMRENRFLAYTISLDHEVYKNLTLGINCRFQDFEYQSSLYYTPSDKRLYGVNISYYFDLSNYYSYLSSSIQLDEYKNFETNYSLELGYTWSKVSIAISYVNSQTPYYQSDSANIILSCYF